HPALRDPRRRARGHLRRPGARADRDPHARVHAATARAAEEGEGAVSENSAIEWTESTWNPVRGCDKVSAGCKNCYAETFAERWRGINGHPFEQGFDLRLVPEALDKPLRWRRPRKIFVNSMSDLFHEDIPNEYIAAVFGVMAACPQHTFQVLTKRAARMRDWFEWLPSHYNGPRITPS